MQNKGWGSSATGLPHQQSHPSCLVLPSPRTTWNAETRSKGPWNRQRWAHAKPPPPHITIRTTSLAIRAISSGVCGDGTGSLPPSPSRCHHLFPACPPLTLSESRTLSVSLSFHLQLDKTLGAPQQGPPRINEESWLLPQPRKKADAASSPTWGKSLKSLTGWLLPLLLLCPLAQPTRRWM